MDVFYYTTSFFHNNKTNTFLFSNNSSKTKTYHKSNSSYDNISHVKEAFTFGVTAAKNNNKRVSEEKLKD